MGEMGVTGKLKKLRDAGDKGKGPFRDADGRPEAKRKDFPISPAKQPTDGLNRYREPKGNDVIGVKWERTVFPTRIHQWTIQHKCEPSKLKRPLELKEPAKRGNNFIASDWSWPLGVLSITVRQEIGLRHRR